MAELGVLDAKAVANDPDGRTRRDALDAACGQLCGAVASEGAQHFACELIKPLQDGSDASARKWGVRLLEHFFANNKTCDYSDQVGGVARSLERQTNTCLGSRSLSFLFFSSFWFDADVLSLASSLSPLQPKS